MRWFWLKKGNSIWDLSSEDLSLPTANFMADPQGLGVKVKMESYEVESSTFIENVKLERAEISGKIYFDGYAQFTAFVSFIGCVETTEPLRLYYSTAEQKPDYNSIDEWYKLVLIKELKKSEIDVKTGKLICDIKFQSVSMWKKDMVVTIEFLPGQELAHPYYYPVYHGGYKYFVVAIDNNGNLPTPCTIRIEAETDTPIFFLMQNDQMKEQAKYNVYIRTGSYLIINSDPIKQEACLYTLNGGIELCEDVYNLGERNYAYSNFITIPSGYCYFYFRAMNEHFGKITIHYSLQRDLV